MSRPLRKSIGIAGIGAGWSLAWAAAFAALWTIAALVRPQDIDAREGLPVAIRTGLAVGLVSGAVHGALLALAEDRKSLADLALARVALWGALAAAAWPLVTEVDDRMTYVLCPLGAAWAIATLVIARRVARFDAAAKWIDRLVAGPLRATCAPDG